MASRRRSSTRKTSIWWACLPIALTILLVLACSGCWLLYRAFSQTGAQIAKGPGDIVVLDIAYTPEKDVLFRELVRRFNSSTPRTPQGKPISVQATSLDAEAMVEAVLAGSFDAISPDSSIWLTQLDVAWRKQQNSQASVVGEMTRYAVSPVVIAMWQDVASAMGYPGQGIGWRDILQRARTDSSFKWSHPSTSSASGLLATLAMFYAGADKIRGLTQEDALAEETLAYVSAVEKTVRYYGEGESAVIERALREGPGFLDAFVVQEQLVIYFNQQTKGPKLVAVYPSEGTLWKDHPLALLERPTLSPEQRQAYQALRDFLLSQETQRYILSQGYRPADLGISLSDPTSPITLTNGVDPKEPQTTLQIPSASVIEMVRKVWWYTKRHTNVFLVADVSGSMEGEKLLQAKEAMHTFVGQIEGEIERVGLITFASDVREAVPLGELRSNRAQLQTAINALSARGNTALLDAVNRAYAKLQGLKDQERINAIVVMTDGRENRSRIRLAQLSQKVRSGNQTGVPVVIFCIAYGSDADMKTLESIAAASGGQARYGDPETIKELYKILSTYF